MSGTDDLNLVTDAGTGKQTGTFPADVVPAFTQTTGFILSSRVLAAVDLGAGNALRTFMGDGRLVCASLLIDSVIEMGSSSGKVYALGAGASSGSPRGPRRGAAGSRGSCASAL